MPLRRRRALPILILAALVTLVLGLAPTLCHAEDLDCQADANHHTALGCQCSCHLAVVLPGSPASAPALRAAELMAAVQPAAPSLSPARLDRPPRH